MHDTMLRDYMAKHKLAQYQSEYLEHVCADLEDLDPQEEEWMCHTLGPDWRTDSAAIEDADSDGSGDDQ